MENINLKLESLPGNEIIIREGAALEQKAPNIVCLSGDINSVSAFLDKRNTSVSVGKGTQEVNHKSAIVLVDKKAMTITLNLDPENPYGATVKGTLESSEELKPFNINASETFTREQLIKILRFNKIHFADPSKHEELLKSYQAFNVTANTDFKSESDTRGNKAMAFNKHVNSNIPTEFILEVPIFKGQPKERFRVEICLDVTDASARFWFESVELHELQQKRIDEIFSKELGSCSEFVVINK